MKKDAKNPTSTSQTSSPLAAVDLYLVGAGVSFPDHLTLQTIEILTACKKIYTNLPASDLEALPLNLRTKCLSVWSLYQENRAREENYNDIAQAVLDGAADSRPCAWMTPGHPMIFDSVTQTLLKAGRTLGWTVLVVPGISSLDTILAEVGYDPADGLLVHEATALVFQGLPLLPSFAALLLQPSAFGTSATHYSDEWRADLSPLRDYLLRFYSAEHACAFVRSSSTSGELPAISWQQVGDLTSVPTEALVGSTLFVPRVVDEQG